MMRPLPRNPINVSDCCRDTSLEFFNVLLTFSSNNVNFFTSFTALGFASEVLGNKREDHLFVSRRKDKPVKRILRFELLIMSSDSRHLSYGSARVVCKANTKASISLLRSFQVVQVEFR